MKNDPNFNLCDLFWTRFHERFINKNCDANYYQIFIKMINPYIIEVFNLGFLRDNNVYNIEVDTLEPDDSYNIPIPKNNQEILKRKFDVLPLIDFINEKLNTEDQHWMEEFNSPIINNLKLMYNQLKANYRLPYSYEMTSKYHLFLL
jgi:hypothetical protein